MPASMAGVKISALLPKLIALTSAGPGQNPPSPASAAQTRADANEQARGDEADDDAADPGDASMPSQHQ